MSKTAGLVVGLLMLPAIAVAQQPSPEFVVGWLSYSAGTISQDLSVRNNGWDTIKTARVRCHFFLYSKRLGAGTVKIKDITANVVGYKTMTVASATRPNSANCRMVSVTY